MGHFSMAMLNNQRVYSIHNKQSADWRFLCDSTSWNTNQHHGTPLGQLASHDLSEARTRFCLKKHRKRTVTQDDPQKIHHSVRIWFIIAMAMAKPVGCEYVVRWTILEDHGRPLFPHHGYPIVRPHMVGLIPISIIYEINIPIIFLS